MTIVNLGVTHPDTLTDYQRFRYSHEAPRTVACDHCGEPVEAYCKSSGGYVVGFHAKRITAVAHLTDADKTAAVTSMLAAIRRRREEMEAEDARRWADPTYRTQIEAQRRWWNEQFDRINEEQRAEERDFRARCTDNPIPTSEWSRSHTDDCRCRLTGEVTLKPRPKVLQVGEQPVTDLTAVRTRKGLAS
jgi:hypothetical protein